MPGRAARDAYYPDMRQGPPGALAEPSVTAAPVEPRPLREPSVNRAEAGMIGNGGVGGVDLLRGEQAPQWEGSGQAPPLPFTRRRPY